MQNRTMQSRNHDKDTKFQVRYRPPTDQGEPPGVATGLLSYFNGAAVAMRQQPRCNLGKPLRQNIQPDFIAHFFRFCPNTLLINEQKMHAQNSRICGQMISISEYCKDLKAFVRFLLSFLTQFTSLQTIRCSSRRFSASCSYLVPGRP